MRPVLHFLLVLLMGLILASRVGVVLFMYTPTEWQGLQLNTSPLSPLQLKNPVG